MFSKSETKQKKKMENAIRTRKIQHPLERIDNNNLHILAFAVGEPSRKSRDLSELFECLYMAHDFQYRRGADFNRIYLGEGAIDRALLSSCVFRRISADSVDMGQVRADNNFLVADFIFSNNLENSVFSDSKATKYRLSIKSDDRDLLRFCHSWICRGLRVLLDSSPASLQFPMADCSSDFEDGFEGKQVHVACRNARRDSHRFSWLRSFNSRIRLFALRSLSGQYPRILVSVYLRVRAVSPLCNNRAILSSRAHNSQFPIHARICSGSFNRGSYNRISPSLENEVEVQKA